MHSEMSTHFHIVKEKRGIFAMANRDMLNTKIYTTNQSVARAFARVCGVKNVAVNDAGIIGYGFNQRGFDHGFVIGFQKGSGFDDGEYKGVSYREVTSLEVEERSKQ